ncbi:hypothetical protein JTB14_008166 [Gonioctena quinquepunctata]|nr:hypothetical protein JTB14_008166 [Gonioctena quinquepunctata]
MRIQRWSINLPIISFWRNDSLMKLKLNLLLVLCNATVRDGHKYKCSGINRGTIFQPYLSGGSTHIELSGVPLRQSDTNAQASTPFEPGVGEPYIEMIEGNFEARDDASTVASGKELIVPDISKIINDSAITNISCSGSVENLSTSQENIPEPLKALHKINEKPRSLLPVQAKKRKTGKKRHTILVRSLKDVSS